MIYNSLATKQNFSIVEDTDGHTFIFLQALIWVSLKAVLKILHDVFKWWLV